MSQKILAITGGTGFVGRVLIAMAVADGWKVRALARQPQLARDGVTWVAGALDRPETLLTLAMGADAIVHLAANVIAPNRDAFAQGNVVGTEAVVKAAQLASVDRFIHISSLAAREPQLSDYGWSKAESEARIAASGLGWTIVRPPAIYGPGDTDHLELFKMAQRGVVLGPPPGGSQ